MMVAGRTGVAPQPRQRRTRLCDSGGLKVVDWGSVTTDGFGVAPRPRPRRRGSVLLEAPCLLAANLLIYSPRFWHGFFLVAENDSFGLMLDFKKLVDGMLLAIKAGTLYAPFTNVTVHKKDNYVYGLAQCRMDVEPEECATCINAAVQQVVDDCQYEPDGRVWYDWCMVRYSTTNFVGKLDTTCYVHYQSPEVATWDGFAKKRYDLFMKDIGSQIAKPWNQGFGKSVYQLDDYNALYGLASCTKDLTFYLSSTLALQALAAAVEQFQKICENSIGCRVVTSSCYVRYETYPFFIPYNGKKNTTTTMAKTETPSLP